MTMPLHPTWQDIALRLVLTVVASALIGLNREARGHGAGFRTTILVGLAACISMVQANILLSVGGKATDSFAVMDILRFPLGVLTGVGFIGGGAILKRGNLVTGVTTAATLWVVTAIGLCLGGGQYGVGIAGTLLAASTLWFLKWIDNRIAREHWAVLTIRTSEGTLPNLAALVEQAGYRSYFIGMREEHQSSGRSFSFEVRWTAPGSSSAPSQILALVAPHYTVQSLEVTTEATR